LGQELDKFLVESAYYDNGIVNEEFTIVLDLSETNIATNYNNVALYMELHDSSGINVRPTLYSTIEKFNIYSEVSSQSTNANLYLTTNYNNDPIIFNSDSSTDISITSGLNYKYINDFKIMDTTYENKEIGLSIRLEDIYENVIDKDHLKALFLK
jgi:hypothetical protein